MTFSVQCYESDRLVCSFHSEQVPSKGDRVHWWPKDEKPTTFEVVAVMWHVVQGNLAGCGLAVLEVRALP